MLKIFMLLFVYIAGVDGSRYCSEIYKIANCRHPGLTMKECSCSCLKPAIDKYKRNYLDIDFNSCARFTRSCTIYKLGFELKIFMDKESIPVVVVKFWINLLENLSFQRFPLNKTTIDTELQSNRSYRLSIQPMCTICEFCRHLPDIVIQPINVNTPVAAKPEIKTSEYLTTLEITGLASLALGACGFVVVFVFVLYKRRPRNRHRNDNLQHRNRTPVENNQHRSRTPVENSQHRSRTPVENNQLLNNSNNRT